MHETRVNLKHLLEDLRDSYGIPLEEIIIVELIANALDSRASLISFSTDQEKNSLTVLDNGQGMKRKEIRNYHDIATTTKVRGRGIGFAGIGAKLSLLIASSVITETKGGYGSRCATSWRLASENRAPWKFIPFSNKVTFPRGTAITINLSKSNSLLLSKNFILETIYRHFYPLLYSEFFQIIYRYIYKKGIKFFVNNEEVSLSNLDLPRPFKTFKISIGKRSKKVAGFGYLAKNKELKNNENKKYMGLAVSTYGKIIKSGWEWIGILPKEPSLIQGVVEIPALAEILTTNKMDFLRDAVSLKKYYQYRKAIQEAIFPILEELGEEIKTEERVKKLSPLTKEIESAIGYILNDFPELISLLGIRKIRKGPNLISEEIPLVKIIEKNPSQSMKAKEKEKSGKDRIEKKEKKEKKRGPRLIISFEERKEDSLARMIENTILINTSHPAYLKSKKENFEEYHILFCVAWVLSGFLEEGRSPQEFINNFLTSWAREEKKTTSLLKI